ALHEPPRVALGVLGAIGAVGPVVLAVVARRRRLLDDRAGCSGALAVGVHVVDEDAHRLGSAAQGARALEHRQPGTAVLGAGAPDHDQTFAVDELGVLDAAAFALDLEADLEVEGAAQPIDGGGGVVVKDGARDAGPAGGGLLHGTSSVIAVSSN